jgi:hypothetical protein
MDSSGFRQFYEAVHAHSTFLHLLKYIDSFIERHKIKIDKRVIVRSRETCTRPQSPKPEVRRVPKFLSPSALALHQNAAVRLSLGVDSLPRRQPQPQPLPGP